MQYLITAYDYTDTKAIERRMEQREAHLAAIECMVRSGNFLSGGAILDDGGRMIGSTVHVSFETREQLEQWLSEDPYMTGKVWETIDIQEVLLFPVNSVKNDEEF